MGSASAGTQGLICAQCLSLPSIWPFVTQGLWGAPAPCSGSPPSQDLPQEPPFPASPVLTCKRVNGPGEGQLWEGAASPDNQIPTVKAGPALSPSPRPPGALGVIQAFTADSLRPSRKH